MIEFNGREFFDDRMFVLCLAEATVELVEDNIIETTVYHDKPPEKHTWCLLTFWNCVQYPFSRLNHAQKKQNAVKYMRKYKPLCPLVSLQGHPPNPPLPYEEYLQWEKENNFQGYDYRKVSTPGGDNYRDIIALTYEDFQKSRID